MSPAWGLMKKILDLKMKSLMTLFAQRVPKPSFPWIDYLFSFRVNTVCLKRKHRIFHYSLRINAIRGQNVCTPPECSISPQEICEDNETAGSIGYPN